MQADFTNFFTNLSNVVSKAGELSTILDELATKELFSNSELSSLLLQKKIQENISRDKSKSDADRNTALEKARKIQQEINQLQQGLAATQKEAAYKTLDSGLANQGLAGNVSRGTLDWAMKESNRSKGLEMKQTYDGKVTDYQTKIDNAKEVNPYTGDLMATKESKALQKELEAFKASKQGQLGKFLSLFYEMADDEQSFIGKAKELNNKANQMLGSISDAELQLNNTDAKINGSFKSNSTSVKVAPAEGSLAKLDAEIAKARADYSNAVTDETRAGIYKALQELQNQKLLIEIEARVDKKRLDGSKEKPTNVLQTRGADLSGIKLKPVLTKKDVKVNNDYLESLSQVATIMGAFSAATDSATAGWLGYTANIISGVAAMLPALASLFGIEAALGIAEQSKLVFPMNVIAMAATGVGLAAAIASIPKMADGGVVYGNSVVNVGEYNGASSNPEVIAPLNKLKKLIKPEGNNSAIMAGEVTFRIKGKELQGVLSNYNTKTAKIK